MSTLPSLLPYLSVSNAAAAIDFYKAALGAEELERHLAPGGTKIMNARLSVNGGTFMLADDFSAEFGGRCSTPEALGGSPVVLHLQVEDVDAAWARMVGAGGIVTMPLADQFWGDRYGQFSDPFGQRWSMAQTKVAMTTDEMDAAAVQGFKM